MELTAHPQSGGSPLRWLTSPLRPLIALLCLLVGTAWGQAVDQPGLSVTPASARPGQTITATATNLKATTTYTLDWGDGITVNFNGPGTVTETHSYTTPSTYPVILTSDDSFPVNRSVTITTPPPTLTITPTTVAPGQTITATAGDLNVEFTYTLDWGDGTTDEVTAGSPTTTHTYTLPGVYPVILSAPSVPPAQQVVTVTAPAPTFTVTPSTVATGAMVTATAANLSPALTYTLDWGDGTTETLTESASATKTHVYTAPGVFPVILSAPGVTPITRTVTVTAPTPTLTVTPSTVITGAVVTAIAANLVPGLTYTLDWGDGTTDTLTGSASGTKTHAYKAPGTFPVTLSAPGVTPAQQVVTVTALPPTLTTTPTAAAPGQTITATAGNLNAELTYTLNWGDGTTVNLTTGSPTATHAYNLPGVFPVILSAPGVTPVQQVVTVTAPAPALTVAPSTVTTGVVVTATAANLVSGLTYSLDWGDGTAADTLTGSTNATKTHTYALPGVFPVILSTPGVTPISRTVTVTAPVPTLTVTDVVQNGQRALASAANLVPGLTYTLDWGDGTSVNLTGTTSVTNAHTYAAPGVYTVILSTPGLTPAQQVIRVIAPPPTLIPTLTVTPSTVTTGAVVTATVGNLDSNFNYTLNWGDGTTVNLTTGSPTAIHTYALPGVFPVILTAPGTTGAQQVVTVTAGAPTLTIQSGAFPGQLVTATAADLIPGLTYTLDWGDGTADTLTGSTNATQTHTYALPGVFPVILSTPGVPPTTRTVTVTGLGLTLNVTVVGLTATAAVGNILPIATYVLEWGDGTSTPFTGATLTHLYPAPGIYTVRITANAALAATTTLTVALPPQESLQLSGFLPDPTGPTYRFKVGSLLPQGHYVVDYGDGTTGLLTGETAVNALLSHKYLASGTYTVALTLQNADGTTTLRTTTVAPVQLPAIATSLALSFTRPQATTDLLLDTLDPFEATLTINYQGGGTLQGSWMLDGQRYKDVTVTLPDGNQSVTVPLPLTETKLGRHTLTFAVTRNDPRSMPGRLLASNPVTYALNVPDNVSFGGFLVKLTGVTTLDPQAFAGTGQLDLVVGGSLVGTQNVTFSGQQVRRDANTFVVTGGAPVSLNLNTQLKNARLGTGTLRAVLNTLTLDKDGGKVSGNLLFTSSSTARFSRGAGSYTFTSSPLTPTGDLLTELTLDLSQDRDLSIGALGMSISASKAVLDLSATQNADALTKAYSDETVPSSDWMGVVFPDVSPIPQTVPYQANTVANYIRASGSSVRATAAYSATGFTTNFDLPSGTLPIAGWNVNLSAVHVSVSGSKVSAVRGTGRVVLPLLTDSADVILGWNPNVPESQGWTFRTDTNSTLPNHSFGRTSIAPGKGTWSMGSTGVARLIFPNATWSLGTVSDRDVALPLSNLTLTATGSASLGGRDWVSLTNNIDLSLFKVPFPVVEVGVQRQTDGSYTLGLRGRFNLMNKLTADVSPVLFWVQGGREQKITFEQFHVTGDLKKAKVDLKVTGSVNNNDNLKFDGTGKLSIGDKLTADATASFGREGGASYGYAIADVTKTPSFAVSGVRLYEFHGGVAVNMDWTTANLDAPPVKRLNGGTTVNVRATVVMGTALRNGELANMKGTLEADEQGNVTITASAWLLTKLENGALGNTIPNGKALIKVSQGASGNVLMQACVGPSNSMTIKGLDCSNLKKVDFEGIVSMSGWMELYAPYSGDGFHMYVGTKEKPISLNVLSVASAHGYLMATTKSTAVGFDAHFGVSYEGSTNLGICKARYGFDIGADVKADFLVVYQPASLGGHVVLDAYASAFAKCGFFSIHPGIGVHLDGDLYVASGNQTFSGNASAKIKTPKHFPDIYINTHVNVRLHF